MIKEVKVIEKVFDSVLCEYKGIRMYVPSAEFDNADKSYFEKRYKANMSFSRKIGISIKKRNNRLANMSESEKKKELNMLRKIKERYDDETATNAYLNGIDMTEEA